MLCSFKVCLFTNEPGGFLNNNIHLKCRVYLYILYFFNVCLQPTVLTIISAVYLTVHAYSIARNSAMQV